MQFSSRLLSCDVKVENCSLQVCNAANSGNFLPTFRATHQPYLQGLRNAPEERSSQLLRGGSVSHVE
jgi:hypothetical protein